MPTILTFHSDSHPVADEQDHIHKVNRPRLPMHTLRPLFWFLKIVILPITATTTALYFLCLYLLKDADLLEAQRNRAEPGSRDPDEIAPLESRTSFSTMPRAFSTDIELIAASKDGRVIASVGMHNELIIVWQRGNDNQTHISIDTADVLLRAASTSSVASAITTLSVDETGAYCAVGTGAGVIAVWSIEDDRVISLPHLEPENSSSGIVDLQFVPSTNNASSLLAIYENGTAAKWYIGDIYSVTYITPRHSGHIVRCIALPVHNNNRLFVAFSMQNGALELTEVTDSDNTVLPPNCLLHAGNPSDPVSQVSACNMELGGIQQLIIGAATEAGAVSLWDGRTGECMHILDDVYGEITNLRISPVPCETCYRCGELPLENFTVSFAVGNIVLFHRAYLSVQTRRCSCARPLSRHTPSRDIRNGRRSRSNSFSSFSSISSNIRLRFPASTSNSQSALDTSSFPVSGHGVHSRRASEKDALRRTENSTLPLVADEHELNHPVGPLDILTSSLPPRASATWHDLTVVRLTETSCDRGSWDILESKIVGVRRKARSHVKAKDGTTPKSGLTVAALDRWELWTFDPCSSQLQSTSLAALTGNHSTEPHPCSRSAEAPRLPFTRVSPFFCSGSHGFGGFGNTVGVFTFSAS